MNAVAIGTDLIAIARVEALLRRHPRRFVERCFTPDERRDVEGSNPRRYAERYAARFAAKEAVLKALGTGLRRGIGWRDIAVLTGPLGAPSLVLHAAARSVADERGIDSWLVSMTHASDYASATVIGLG
ncbi:MAG: holo-ACP synthase [Planctomycetota bacterium]